MPKATIAEEFIHRLQSAERTGQLKPLCELFTNGAQLENLTRHNTSSHHVHTEAATSFWRQYLSAFREIESRFFNVTLTEQTAVLEWRSSGVLSMGVPIDYAGVTIFEFADGKITQLRTYYDTAAFMPHAAHSQHTHGLSVGSPEISSQASS